MHNNIYLKLNNYTVYRYRRWLYAYYTNILGTRIIVIGVYTALEINTKKHCQY